MTYLARLLGGDECRRSVPTDVPAQVSDGTVESAVDKELTRLTALERLGGVLSLIIRLRNHVCAQAQDQVERRGPNSEVWERERRSEAGRVEEVMQARAHGPPALRPFPDADAPISCSGNAARRTTEGLSDQSLSASWTRRDRVPTEVPKQHTNEWDHPHLMPKELTYFVNTDCQDKPLQTLPRLQRLASSLISLQYQLEISQASTRDSGRDDSVE